MAHSFDIAEELATAVRNPETTWRFLRNFVAQWSAPPADGDGFTEEELRAAETELGVRLPDSVRRLYTLLGRRDDLTRNQDWLLGPQGLHFDETGRVLVFRTENQGCAHWGIAVHELRLADPPVIFQLEAPHIAAEPWRPFLDRFSLACIEMVFSECLFSEAPMRHDNQEATETSLQALENRFARLPLPDYPMWATPDDLPIRWFSSPDVLIRNDSDAWIWVGARTPEALQETREAIPGDWLIAPFPP